jgi:hypothetical protein
MKQEYEIQHKWKDYNDKCWSRSVHDGGAIEDELELKKKDTKRLNYMSQMYDYRLVRISDGKIIDV